MIILVYVFLIILLYFLGYVMSLYSSVAYVEPERMEHNFEKLSDFKRRYLEEIQNNPRAALQLSTVFKSLVLILVSLLTILISNRIIFQYELNLDFAVIGALLLVWIIYLVFIEIIPSSRVLALIDKEMRFLSLYISIYILFKPMLSVYGKIFAHETTDSVTEDQKEDIVERAIETLAEQAGIEEPIVEEDEKEMIGQIFQLDVTEVREVMIPRIDIKGIPKNATVDDIRDMTREAGYSRYPVFDDSPDKIIGILYVKDLFTALNNNHGEFDILKYMREPFYVSEKKKISDLMAEFKAAKIHIAIVVDEYGGTSGLVTLEDILEEIVGEIEDEHDFGPDPVIHLPDNSLRVSGGVSVEELLEELKLDYETEEFETIGGLIYDLVGSVPKVGTTLKWKDLIFEVDKVDGQRIISVKIWLKKGTDI